MTEKKHILEYLHKYMFLHNICSSRESKIPPQEFFSSKKTTPETIKSNIFVPEKKDKLFWCFYILYHGMENYHAIDQNHYQIETSTKISIAENLKNNEILLKQNKLKREVIENELVNEKKISMEGMKALCVLHKIDILFIFEKMFYQISSLSEEAVNIIELDKKGDFGIVNSLSEERKKHIHDNYYEILDYNKKIKSISAYKLDELKNIASKFDIIPIDSIGNKKTKKKLYEEIVSHL